MATQAADAARLASSATFKANGVAMQGRTVDMRSDTVTKPTDAMREAMAKAEVGDDVYGEDPCVNRLQQVAAEMLGMEAALFVASGTQGNLAAVLAHCDRRGSEVMVGDESHVYHYEAGGMSVLGGVAFNVVRTQPSGELLLEDLDKAYRPDDEHFARSACLCIENTHNRCGGKVLSLDHMRGVKRWADGKGLPVHLDGARVFNAATALGVPVSAVTAHVTSVQLCLSKGLGAPAGSLVAGPRSFIARVFRYRKMLGGGMRQAGVLAAPGLIALTEMSQRLATDHENAAALAAGLAEIPQISIDLAGVHSNIVVFWLKPEAHLSPAACAIALRERGVLLAPFVAGSMRAVTHVQVSADDVVHTLTVIRGVLAAAAAAGPSQDSSAAKSPYGEW